MGCVALTGGARADALSPASTSEAADLKREKYERLMADNYVRAKSTIFGGWHDSELRDWLVSHNLVKSDYQAKRDDMIKLIGDKWVRVGCRATYC